MSAITIAATAATAHTAQRAFVAATAFAALVVPESGKSYAVVSAIALGYALAAMAYARASRGVATGLRE